MREAARSRRAKSQSCHTNLLSSLPPHGQVKNQSKCRERSDFLDRPGMLRRTVHGPAAVRHHLAGRWRPGQRRGKVGTGAATFGCSKAGFTQSMVGNQGKALRGHGRRYRRDVNDGYYRILHRDESRAGSRLKEPPVAQDVERYRLALVPRADAGESHMRAEIAGIMRHRDHFPYRRRRAPDGKETLTSLDTKIHAGSAPAPPHRHCHHPAHRRARARHARLLQQTSKRCAPSRGKNAAAHCVASGGGACSPPGRNATP